MRFAMACVLVIATSACTLHDDEEADASEQDVTGGSSSVASPVVFLFDGIDTSLAPKCAGALLGDKIAVTLAACAKPQMIVGLASDKDGKGTSRAKIAKVHLPSARAEIAVVELDRVIGGTRAVITHAALRDGYTVNGVATEDGGWFGPSKGDASNVKGRLTSETDTYATLYAASGKEICADDLGAPVCSSTGTMFLSGMCGLSGLVTGREDSGTQGCSNGAWKMVPLGSYADFLKEHAPEAFEPLVIERSLWPDSTFLPDGLWGYQTSGRVAACKIETTKLDPVDPNASAKLRAKVSFRDLEERATPIGRFGIASAKAPAKMRWLPAKQIESSGKKQSIDATFEGAVSALDDGDYVVAFRASASGGETWTTCDVDGIENGFSVDKTVRLTVSSTRHAPTPIEAGTDSGSSDPDPSDPKPGDPDAGDPKPGEPGAPANGDDASAPPPPSTAESAPAPEYSDPSPSDSDQGDTGSSGDEPLTKKKKNKSDSGCSATPGGRTTNSLPLLALALGVAAIRRRRARARRL